PIGTGENSVKLSRLALSVLAGGMIAAGASVYLGAENQQGLGSLSPRVVPAFAAFGQAPGAQMAPQKALINRYCVGCHNQRTKSGNLRLDEPAGRERRKNSPTGEKA